jgi:hypothetical protein
VGNFNGFYREAGGVLCFHVIELSGADAYLCKPYDNDVLLDKVSELINRRRRSMSKKILVVDDEPEFYKASERNYRRLW